MSKNVTLRDKDIREPLFDFLEAEYGKIRIIEEKTVGKSRTDVVIVTEDALYGIEIKSDADTYTRLSRQVKDYDRFFDYNYVVAGTSHAHHIEEHVPDSWGIITVERPDGQEADFYILRRPDRNAKRDMVRKLIMLWRPELTHILLDAGMPKYSGKSKKYITQKLTEKIPKYELDRMISEELFERDYTVFGR